MSAADSMEAGSGSDRSVPSAAAAANNFNDAPDRTNSGSSSSSSSSKDSCSDWSCGIVPYCTNQVYDQIKHVLNLYQQSLKSNPLLTKSLTSCVIGIIGEILGTYLKNRKQIALNVGRFNAQPQSKVYGTNEHTSTLQLLANSMDLRRIATFGSLGLLVVGPIFHYWYGYLEKLSNKVSECVLCAIKKCTNDTVSFSDVQKSVLQILVKLTIQQVIFTPAYVLFTLAYIQYFINAKATYGGIVKNIQNSFAVVLLTNLKVWTPAQAVNFTYVPLEYRVLYGNMVALWWNIYLSTVN